MPPAPRRLSLLLLFAAALGAADDADRIKLQWKVGDAQRVTDEDRLTVAAGKLCTVRTTLDAAAAATFAGFIDDFAGVVKGYYGGEFANAEPLTVYVFAHGAEYTDFFALHRAGQAPLRDACYDPACKATLVTLADAGDPHQKRLELEVMKHELTHHILHFYLGTDAVPPWLDEGMACYFQYWNTAQKPDVNLAKNATRATSGRFGYFPRWVGQHLGKPEFLAPAELFALKFEDFHADKEKEYLFYSESWAFANFLISRPDGRKLLGAIVDQVRTRGACDIAALPIAAAVLRDAWYDDIRKRVARGIR